MYVCLFACDHVADKAGIALTGNYGFFNMLSCVPAAALLDDQQLQFIVSRLPSLPALAAPAPVLSAQLPLSVVWDSALIAACIGGWLLYACATTGHLLMGINVTPSDVDLRAQQVLGPLHLSYRYGLFAGMTTTRDEVVVRELHELPEAVAREAGSLVRPDGDGRYWVELSLPYKPGPIDRPPPWLLFHMPRLDWQCWFLSLSLARGRPLPQWFDRFIVGLRERRHDVVQLVAHKGQPAVQDFVLGRAPLDVRVSLEDYEYADPADPEPRGPDWERGEWWQRRVVRDTIHGSWNANDSLLQF
eukprot:TRINITY_DN30855_c0_g1_i1.p1 TRINITY_DN30855_c0_g1~~TRINITY_DN30855_c0_g1_i1.p1  ORF type:complete len:326 (+),score=37.55 TRINITY_DN30855_c0_g1_i1:73-978(+)